MYCVYIRLVTKRAKHLLNIHKRRENTLQILRNHIHFFRLIFHNLIIIIIIDIIAQLLFVSACDTYHLFRFVSVCARGAPGPTYSWRWQPEMPAGRRKLSPAIDLVRHRLPFRLPWSWEWGYHNLSPSLEKRSSTKPRAGKSERNYQRNILTRDTNIPHEMESDRRRNGIPNSTRPTSTLDGSALQLTLSCK